MINPVNNNNRPEYQAQTRRVNSSEGSSEHFSLRSGLNSDDGTEGVIYEPGSDELPSKAMTSPKKEPETFEKKLDEEILKRREGKEEAPDEFTATFYRLWGYVERFFKGLWGNIKKIFGNLWDSKPIGEGLESMAVKKEDSSDAGSGTKRQNSVSVNADKSDSLTSSLDALEASRDESIRAALKEGDKDKFRNLISDGGRRTPAHNSAMQIKYSTETAEHVNFNHILNNKNPTA